MVSSTMSSRFGEGFRRPSDREDIACFSRGQLGLVESLCPLRDVFVHYLLGLLAHLFAPSLARVSLPRVGSIYSTGGSLRQLAMLSRRGPRSVREPPQKQGSSSGSKRCYKL